MCTCKTQLSSIAVTAVNLHLMTLTTSELNIETMSFDSALPDIIPGDDEMGDYNDDMH